MGGGAIKSSIDRWYSRLGHPAIPIVQRVIRKFDLPCLVQEEKDLVCNACHQVKSHQLPYPKSALSWSGGAGHPAHLELLNCRLSPPPQPFVRRCLPSAPTLVMNLCSRCSSACASPALPPPHTCRSTSGASSFTMTHSSTATSHFLRTSCCSAPRSSHLLPPPSPRRRSSLIHNKLV
jgi:hypothetical protein